MGKKQFLWWYEDPDEFAEWKFLNSLPDKDKKQFSPVINDKIKRYGNIYFYRPIPKLEPFHKDNNDDRLVYGNNGSGKSMGAGAETAYEFIGWSPYRDIPAPDFGSRLIWITTTDYKIQQDSSQLILFADVLSPSKDIGLLPDPDYLDAVGFEVIWEDKKKGILGAVVNPWSGTRLVFKSMKSDTQSFAGAPLDFAWADEIIPRDKWDELGARTLRKHGRRIMSFLIQDAQESYTFTELYSQYQADLQKYGASSTSFYFLALEDNTYLDAEDVAKRKKKFTEDGAYWRFTEGGFFPVEPKGTIIYEDFVPEHHVKVDLVKEFNPMSTLYCVWDLGSDRPCCTAFQIDQYNRKKILFTILGKNIQLRNFIDEVDAKTKELFPQCMSIHDILPHDAARRPATGVTNLRATDVFKAKKRDDYSIIYVHVEPAIVLCNEALGNWIKKKPEIQIDADHAMLFQNMCSLYARDDNGKPKKDKYLEHISDNFKLMMAYCKRIGAITDPPKELNPIQRDPYGAVPFVDIGKNVPEPNYLNKTYGEYD